MLVVNMLICGLTGQSTIYLLGLLVAVQFGSGMLWQYPLIWMVVKSATWIYRAVAQ